MSQRCLMGFTPENPTTRTADVDQVLNQGHCVVFAPKGYKFEGWVVPAYTLIVPLDEPIEDDDWAERIE